VSCSCTSVAQAVLLTCKLGVDIGVDNGSQGVCSFVQLLLYGRTRACGMHTCMRDTRTWCCLIGCDIARGCVHVEHHSMMELFCVLEAVYLLAAIISCNTALLQ
jgi:hypothetical protein